MKRWIRSLIMIVCVLCLTACGSTTTTTTTDALEMTEDQIEQYYSAAEQVILAVDEAVRSGSDEQYANDAVLGPAFDSYKTSMQDIGDVVSVEGKDIEFTDSEGTITMLVTGTSHDAEVVIMVESGDSGYEMTSIVTNVTYSFGELIQQAGLNTLLGMGMTFCVLILLAVIISLFGKIITGFTDRKNKIVESKNASEDAKTVQTALHPVEELEELADDTELVAVIAAAIAAYEGQTSTDGFVVRSIRKARKRY